MSEDKRKETSIEEEQPDFIKILIATIIGILILGGITYAGYRYSQKKAGVTLPGGVTYLGEGDCSGCVGKTEVRSDGWDKNNDNKINDCNEACFAFWGPQCNGNNQCANPGSTNAGACCNCITSTGESCATLPPPSKATGAAQKTPTKAETPSATGTGNATPSF